MTACVFLDTVWFNTIRSMSDKSVSPITGDCLLSYFIQSINRYFESPHTWHHKCSKG